MKMRGELCTVQTDEDDKKRLVQNSFLPLDLVLCIIAHLPSLALFDCRRLCKAARPRALRALSRRPFFVLQEEPPSSLCFLLPLDPPCSPLPCSFNLAKPSFRLVFSSGNLLCLQRYYALLLDVCVCNVFWKWKIVLPPIVHPSLGPRLTRHVFFEDSNVEFLSVVGFHAVQPAIDTHEEADAHQVFSPSYRIFVACEAYLQVFDSRLNHWSDPVHFPSHLYRRPSLRSKNPVCYTTSDGNLILSFYSKGRALFKYEDQSFHAMELGFHPGFEVAGYLASAEVDTSFNLKLQLCHVEECIHGIPQGGHVLQGLCEGDIDTPYADNRVSMRTTHRHRYSRHLLHSFCHAYQGKVYALVMERDEMHCTLMERDEMHYYTEDAIRQLFESDRLCQDPEHADLQLHEATTSSSRCHNVQWHELPSEDLEKYLHPDKDDDFDCDHIFPACSGRKLTLYSACIDTTNWTMKVSKEADATTFLDIFNNKGGTFSFMGG